MERIVIVGGVAVGATAATRLRRLSETDEIILLERGEYISFANCGLPYYVGNIITKREDLLVQTVENMKAQFNLDIRIQSEAVSIDTLNNKLTVRDIKKNTTYELVYDKLVLAPGARPILPKIEGIEDAVNIFSVRNIPDVDKITHFIKESEVQRAVVVGGGFIGMEIAENLIHRGIHVDLVERESQVLRILDPEMASFVHERCSYEDVTLHLGNGVVSFKKQGEEVVLQDGTCITTDMIIFAVGVTPEIDLAKAANLEIGETGGIRVNEFFQTSVPNIYAGGDVIEVKHKVSQQMIRLPLAGPANRHARCIADHIHGKGRAYEGVVGTSVLKFFDLTIATTGLSEEQVSTLGLPYECIHIHPNNHASYYPLAQPIVLKVIFNKETGVLFGAQAVGGVGTEKRIDVLAMAMKGEQTIQDLQDVELSYAPPFSSAKDPVNMIGYLGEHVLQGDVNMLQPHNLEAYLTSGGKILDVRRSEEVLAGSIEGSIHIPLHELRERISELTKETPYAVVCQVGQRAYAAYMILKHEGFENLALLSGGYKLYKTLHRKQDVSSKEKCSKVKEEVFDVKAMQRLDARGLQCPGPIMQTFKYVEAMKEGDKVEILASDIGFATDIIGWCDRTGNTLSDVSVKEGIVKAIVTKGQEHMDMSAPKTVEEARNVTLVLFSGDMDKVMAALIIASGAAAIGKKVTVFATFWGLNALRKSTHVPVSKSFLDRLFGRMMPRGIDKLTLSKMNYMGFGKKMMQHVMKTKNVESLPELYAGAKEAGVDFIACTMSMDVLGIQKEELVDDITYAGVGTYIARSEDATLTLFV